MGKEAIDIKFTEGGGHISMNSEEVKAHEESEARRKKYLENSQNPESNVSSLENINKDPEAINVEAELDRINKMLRDFEERLNRPSFTKDQKDIFRAAARSEFEEFKKIDEKSKAGLLGDKFRDVENTMKRIEKIGS